MLPFKLFYSSRYFLDLGEHIFPAAKYRMVSDLLLERGWAEPADFVSPQVARPEDVLLAHSAAYFEKISSGKLSLYELMQLEIPYSPAVYSAFMFATGGTIAAASRALCDSVAVNLGGGFHHACADHGEGFCLINDLAVAIRRLQKDGAIARAMVIDCDVHQGNGTAAIFRNDPTVYTFSIHQENNYPVPKEKSSLDIGLPDGANDQLYLKELERGLEKAFAEFKPDIILYQAGADPYREDQLGGLGLSIAGLKRRDELVLATAREKRVPVAVTLGGGYARKVSDTVLIHCNTILAVAEAARKR